MIATLDVIGPKKGIKNRLKGIFSAKKPIIIKKSYLSYGYTAIYIPAGRKAGLKKRFCSALHDAKIGKDDLLIPSNDFPVSLFPGNNFVTKCEELRARMLLNFLKSSLKNAKNPRKNNILIIDKRANAVSAAAELISLCNVYVCTDRFDLYRPCAEYCFQKYGDAPKKDDKFVSICAAFAPFGREGVLLPNSSTPVLSPIEQEGFSLSACFLSEFLTGQIPENIANDIFLEGMLKKFCAPEILEYTPESLVFQGIAASTDSFAEKFFQ